MGAEGGLRPERAEAREGMENHGVRHCSTRQEKGHPEPVQHPGMAPQGQPRRPSESSIPGVGLPRSSHLKHGPDLDHRAAAEGVETMRPDPQMGQTEGREARDRG